MAAITVFDVCLDRHLDASLVTCDVEPWYVRVTVKGKVLQLVMMEEVRPGQATAQRSQVTGHLVVTMPKVRWTVNGFVVLILLQIFFLVRHKKVKFYVGLINFDFLRNVHGGLFRNFHHSLSIVYPSIVYPNLSSNKTPQ